jgi:heat shock protein HtpX
MVLTMAVLGLLYVAFGAVLVSVGVPPVVVLVGVAGFFVAQWLFADRVAVFAMHAREVNPAEFPELHGSIDRLCALADMPKPRVAVVDSDVPNAFAAGRSQRRTMVCVTTGILRRLTAEELDGVLAHELSHVAHRDVAVMTIASFLGVLAGIITRFGIQAGMVGGFRRRNRDSEQALAAAAVILAISAVVYGVSFVLTRALSRYRELAADRAGALLTGRPSALASALVKLSDEMGRIPTRDLRQAEPFNAFFFAPAVAPGLSLTTLFATHPSLTRRLDALGRLSVDLGGAG